MREKQMQIEKIEAGRLKAAAYNPRKDLKPGDAEFEKLKRSIEEFGYVEPVIWNKRTGNVVGGHQRLKVLQHLGQTEVDCVIVDLDDQKEKALNIALNKISGSWDDALLATLLKDLEQSGFDVSLTGFEAAEVKDLFGAGSIENAHEDDFDEERALEETPTAVTQDGDVWQLGRHRLLCGDSTVLEAVRRFMDGERADIMVTDPPYNVNYKDAVEYHNNGEHKSGRAVSDIANDNMGDKEFYEFLSAFYTAAHGVLKEGAAAYIFHSTKETVNFTEAMKAAGFKVAQTLVWLKNHFTLGRQDYQWIHEPILYGWKEGGGHYFIDDRTNCTVFENAADIRKMKKEELAELVEKIFAVTQTTVLRCDKPVKSPDHPTMKPIMLCAKLIYNSSREGDVVYEPFGGSGSTLIAAEQLSRVCRAIELDGRYCDVIVKRFRISNPTAEVCLLRNGAKIAAETLGF
jgi:DNA modification methylase